MPISYEWSVEELDSNNDIIDSYFFDTEAYTLDNVFECVEDLIIHGLKVDVTLLKNKHSKDGDLKDRGYAYIQKNGELETEFCNGDTVSARYRKAVKEFENNLKFSLQYVPEDI